MNAPRPRLVTALFLLLGSAGPASAQSIVFGAGMPHPWVTEYFAINEQETAAHAFVAAFLVGAPCPDPCPLVRSQTLPPNGSALFNDVPFGFPGFVAVDGDFGARVRFYARTYNSAHPEQWTELPVVPAARINALNPSTLTFPIPPQTARANLLLANVSAIEAGAGADVELELVLYSGSGEALATRNVDLRRTSQSYIVDIANYFAV